MTSGHVTSGVVIDMNVPTRFMREAAPYGVAIVSSFNNVDFERLLMCNISMIFTRLLFI